MHTSIIEFFVTLKEAVGVWDEDLPVVFSIGSPAAFAMTPTRTIT
jgi:hypothetical protein